MTETDYEYINLKEYVEWLKQLESAGKIINLRIERIENDHIDITFKPVNPVEFMSVNLKLNQ